MNYFVSKQISTAFNYKKYVFQVSRFLNINNLIISLQYGTNTLFILLQALLRTHSKKKLPYQLLWFKKL